MNPLVKKFGETPRWVNWKLETRKGKTTKLPYTITGKLASSTNPKTWSTYVEAKAKSKNVGIVLTTEKTLLCVDMDHVLENKKFATVFLNLKKFVDEANTYTEISQSGTGLHLFFEINEALNLEANRHENIECYVSARYIAFTENSFGKEKQVRKVTSNEMIAILSTLGYPWGKQEKIAPLMVSRRAGPMDDADLLKKIFASKNGAKIEALYNGDLSGSGDNASSADLALCSHLAFWTGRDPKQIESIWMASPLGQREKTQKRQDYRDRTVSAAIKNCKEVYESQAAKVEKVSPGLELLFTVNRFKEEIFVQNTENMCRILRAHPEFAGKFRYDIFRNTFEQAIDGKWKPFEDNDAVRVQTRIQVLYPPFLKVGKDIVYDAMIKIAKENEIDSAADWLRSLVWDGKARLDQWIPITYGTPDDEYHQKVGANWLKGLVKRIVEPGSKFDYVLVLEGKQGIRKSTSLLVLGGDWHVETTMSTDNKDFFMQFQGKAIIEFSEGETLSRTEVKRMKAVITMQSDKYRPPYERTSQDFPRRCVFAMTTNQDQYLKDETGNRRWLPVAIKQNVNIEWLKENRDQLYAEAYQRVIVKRETTYEFPEEETARQQALRQAIDPREEQIYKWYWYKLGNEEREAGITSRDAYVQGVQGGSAFGKEMGRLEEIVIGSILRDGLKLERRRTMNEGSRYYRYYEGRESSALAPKEKRMVSIELIPLDL